MATHSSILAQRILWTKEPGRGPRGHKESDRTKATQHDVVRENRTGHLSDSYLHFVIKDKYLFLFNKIKKKIFGCTTRFVVSQFPDQRWNPKPQQRKSRILTTGLPGNSQGSLYLIANNCISQVYPNYYNTASIPVIAVEAFSEASCHQKTFI